VKRPREGIDRAWAPEETDASSLGGNAATQAGGPRTASVALARPGQAQSPRLSSQTCDRETVLAADIPWIQRNTAAESQPLHEPAHALAARVRAVRAHSDRTAAGVGFG
jgi:hypothetical protein